MGLTPPHIVVNLQDSFSLSLVSNLQSLVKSGTPVEAIGVMLHLVDQVLVMTVNPGFGGQAFLPKPG